VVDADFPFKYKAIVAACPLFENVIPEGQPPLYFPETIVHSLGFSLSHPHRPTWGGDVNMYERKENFTNGQRRQVFFHRSTPDSLRLFD